METKTIEEKVKTVILEEIKNLADKACDNLTDDNICELFNAVEYLKTVLKNNSYTSPISTWYQSQLADNVLMRARLTTSDAGDNNIARTFDGKL